MAEKLTPQQVLGEIRKRAGAKRLVLHVNCGKGVKLPERYADWFEVRADRDAKLTPHLITAATDLHMLPPQAVDALVVSRATSKEVDAGLKVWHGALKDGGALHLRLPEGKIPAKPPKPIGDALDKAGFVNLSILRETGGNWLSAEKKSAVSSLPHPGALWPGKRSDELDVPPRLKIV